MASAHQVGDALVVLGHGVGRVASRDAEKLVVRLSEGEIAVKLVDAEALLRPVVDEATARTFLARLCEACDEQRTLPEARSHRELARLPLEQQVEYARWSFRKRASLTPRERDLILAVGENVMAEIAASLGVAASGVLAAVKRGTPVIGPATNRALPPAPPIEDCELLRSFWLGPVAVVGESPEHGDVIRVSVKPGAWHAYVQESEDDEGFDGMLLLHADHPGGAATGATVLLGEVDLEGGRIGVLDAAALDDPAFGLDGVERTRRNGACYGDRGVDVSTFGDGGHQVRVDAVDRATLIALPF